MCFRAVQWVSNRLTTGVTHNPVTAGHLSRQRLCLAISLDSPACRPFVFLSFRPPSSSPSPLPSDRAVFEPFIALQRCCREKPQPCSPRRSLPNHLLMTITRQSPRTMPLSPWRAQVQRVLSLRLSCLPSRANEFLRKDRMLPSSLNHDPLQPPLPPPL